MAAPPSDFFEAQSHALRQSRRLIVLFGLAVASMIALVYLAAIVLLGVTVDGAEQAGWLQPELLAVVAGGMLLLIGGGTGVRMAQLRKGGPAVASLLGGREVDPGTQDPGERRLWNVVEEMSIASGTPVPSVFVLDGEPGINAFAAGHSIHDAAVAVTRGAIETLSRDELQGVVAHEFSHILNGDMRLNVRLMGLLFGILLLTVIGRGILHGAAMGGGRRRGRGGGGGQVAIFGIVLVALGFLGVFFGRLMQAAVSRQREFLADAAAVQFTRNPQGLAGALRKIGSHSNGSTVTDHHAQEVGHLFFANGVRGAFSGLFSTHPPLEERIRRIDPTGDGELNAPAPTPAQAMGGAETASRGSTSQGRGGSRAPAPGLAAAGATFPLASAIVAAAGAPRPEHVAYARKLLAELDPELRDALRTPAGALATVGALLLSEDETVRTEQVRQLRDSLGEDAAREAEGLRPHVDALGAAGRLPLLDLALPALRQLPPERRAALRRVVPPLVRADGEVRTFDYALFHVLSRAVPGEEPGRGRRGKADPSALRSEIELLLSAVARAGADEEEDQRTAFERGIALLPIPGPWTFRARRELDLERVDAALSRLEGATPPAVKAFLEAAAEVVRADGRARVEEVEMLRALAEGLDAPMPPVLAEEAEPRNTDS